MKRIGIYGGSFDPVHYGHLLLAECCREQLALDEIWWVPAFRSPFKQDRTTTNGTHRLEMLRLATAGHAAFRVDDTELRQARVSYTVDTLESFHQAHPDRRWFLLMGSDSLAGFRSWHRPDRILELATLLVARRPRLADESESLVPAETPSPSQPPVPYEQVEMPLIGISSTALRAHIRAGRSIRYQTPRAVETYIAEHGLYGRVEGGG